MTSPRCVALTARYLVDWWHMETEVFALMRTHRFAAKCATDVCGDEFEREEVIGQQII